MAVKGEAIAVVLDVGKSMHSNKSCPTALEDAKKCISMIIQRKIFSESKDEIALILFGCDVASDSMDESACSELENIRIVQSLQPANWKLFDMVNDIEGTDISTDSIRHLALETSANLLQNSVNIKKIDSKRILFLSNFDGYFYSNKMAVLCDELKKSEIEINIIGPVAFSDDIKREYDDELKCHVSDLLRNVNGESYSFSDVLPALTLYQMKKPQPTPANVTLDLLELSIPISVFVKVSESKPKSWGIACAHNVSVKPKRSTTYCMNDELQTKVSYDDLIPAFKYGTTLVPYSQDDKKNMDYEPGEKGMKLLCFLKAEKIKRYLYIGDKSRYVFSRKDNESAGEALSALIRALNDAHNVAIVRYVPTARSAPIIGFLSPRIKPNYECLVFIALPYMEDLRHFIFSPLDSDSKNMPTEDQLNAIDDLISAMDMTNPVDDDDDEEILKPRSTVNPYVQRLYQCLQYKAYHPEKPLPEIEPSIQAIINPVPKLLKRAETALQRMKSLFPIKEYVPKKLPDKSLLFSNSTSDESIRSVSVNDDAPEAKFNVTDAKLVDAMTDKITQVGSINPVRDIQYLINNQILPFSEICDQINDVLNKLLQESDRLRFNYPKILSICKEYRCSSLKKADCEKYNLFMLSLRKQSLELNAELWDKLRDEKVSLISKEELPSSTVSSEEAEMFLSKPCLPENAKDSIEAAVPFDVDDEDDLMDQL